MLSPNFFRKHWTAAELNGMFTIAVSQGKTLVPVWLDVTASEVTEYSPMLADKVALKAEDGVPQVAEKLQEILARDSLHRLNREVYVYNVDVAGKAVQMVTPIPGDWLFKHAYGLPTEAVFGLLVRHLSKGGFFVPHNFRENLRFVRFLHRIIAQCAYVDPNLHTEAKRQNHGYVVLIDRRTHDLKGEIPPEDILGSVRVDSGKPVSDSYQANYNHLLLTENGFFVLPSEDYETTLISEIRKRCAGATEEAPAVELREML